MQKNNDDTSSIEPREIFTHLYAERRISSRYQTTIVVENKSSEEQLVRRGDINKNGSFFVPGIFWKSGTKVVLKVRLPGLGEWVNCDGEVTGIGERGKYRGIVGRIHRVVDNSAEIVDLWRDMSK